MIARPLPPRTARLAGLAACAVAALAVSGARADVYKCEGEGGRPVYQEMPCPKGKELRNFQSDPPEITVLPGLKSNGASPSAPAPRTEKDSKGGKAATAKADKPRGDPAERKHLHTGMSEGEVLLRVGPPDATTGAKNGKQVRWSWFPTEGDPETLTTVTLVSGIVSHVERTLIKR